MPHIAEVVGVGGVDHGQVWAQGVAGRLALADKLLRDMRQMQARGYQDGDGCVLKDTPWRQSFGAESAGT